MHRNDYALCNETVNLNTHIALVHDSSSKFPCDICGTSFAIKGMLDQHLKWHSHGKIEK